LLLMRDYAGKREAFGKKLEDHLLHFSAISDSEVLYRAMLQLLVEECLILGRAEVENSSSDVNESLLRIITPIGKMFSAIISSEMLLDGAESFGGAGYMEDTKIFTIFADTFVNRIWEGTGNIMSLDLLRCLHKEPHTLHAFFEYVENMISPARSKLSPFVSQVEDVLKETKKYLSFVSTDPSFAEIGSKQLCLTLGNVFVTSLLIRHSLFTGKQEDVFTLQRWIELKPLNVLVFPSKERIQLQRSLAFGPHHKKEVKTRKDPIHSKL